MQLRKFKFYNVYLITLLFTFFGCDRHNPFEASDFSVQSLNSGMRGWVLLHSLDGSQCLQAIKITGDKKYSFGLLDTNRVTVTIINNSAFLDMVYPIEVQSFIDVMAGDWKIKGRDYLDRGTVSFSTHSAINGVNTDNFYKCYSLPGWTLLSNTGSVYYLADGNKLSIFARAESPSGDSAYFGWLLKQDFEPNFDYYNHPYDIPLTVPMGKFNISTSKPVDRLGILGYRDSFFHSYSIYFRGFPEATTQHQVFHCPTAPVSFFRFGCSYYEPAGRFTYFFTENFSNEIPSNFVISDASIMATYNDQTQSYENIIVSGAADMITGTWNYYRGNYHENYVNPLLQWGVSVNEGIQFITRPFIPDSIWSDLGILPTDSSDHSNIMIQDWDSANDIDDYIRMNYISEQRFVTLYSKYYSYRSSMSSGPLLKNIPLSSYAP